jgi:hypothetical protein
MFSPPLMSISAPKLEAVMLDTLFLAAGIGSFVLCVLYVVACEHM